MAKPVPKIRIDIVTAERSVYSGEGDVLIAPSVEGEIAILPKHAPLLTQLQPGEIVIRSDTDETSMSLSGGFLEVLGDRVIILADTVERADEIDVDRAEAAMRKAEERVANRESDQDLDRVLTALARSRARLRVARRRRSRGATSASSTT